MAQLDPLAVAIGTAARGAITEAGYSIASFAKESGIPINTLSRRFNGHIPLNYPELVLIVQATGLSMAELVARADRIAARTAA